MIRKKTGKQMKGKKRICVNELTHLFILFFSHEMMDMLSLHP